MIRHLPAVSSSFRNAARLQTRVANPLGTAPSQPSPLNPHLRQEWQPRTGNPAHLTRAVLNWDFGRHCNGGANENNHLLNRSRSQLVLLLSPIRERGGKLPSVRVEQKGNTFATSV